MSRSRQKHLYLKIAGGSNKLDRSKANRKLRHINKIKIHDISDDTLFFNLKDVSNPWTFKSDGLAHYVGTTSRRNEPFTIVEMHKFYGK